jgi:hypothetical protein
MVSKSFRRSFSLVAALCGLLACSGDALALPMPLDGAPVEATPATPEERTEETTTTPIEPNTSKTTRLSILYGGGSHAIGLLSGDSNGTTTQMAIVMELIASGVDEPYLEGVGVDGSGSDWTCFVLLAENIDPAVLDTINTAIAAVLASHPPV